jgi:putative heme-binding domain-containing protein
VTTDTIPAAALPLLTKAAAASDLSAAALANIIACITKTDNAAAWAAVLNALAALDEVKGSGKEQEAGKKAFFEAPKLENVHQALEAEAAKVGTPTAPWAEAALLTLASRKTGSPEAREMSQKALDAGWTDAKRRFQIIRAAQKIKSHAMDEKILAALADPDPRVASAAQNAVKDLKLASKRQDNTAKVSSLKPEDVVAAVLKMKGDAGLGEQLFTRLTCVACHTTSQDQAPKGPYLGNIAQTYKRPDLAMAILDPNKTIAQGFTTEVITLKDGTVQMGFVTLESADTVKLRNVAAQEFNFKTTDISKRDKLPMSIMPMGLVAGLTVKEFASLLDYLEALAKK